MCGRFVLQHSSEQIALRFNTDGTGFPVEPRFNIAPTQDVVVITARPEPDTHTLRRVMETYRWGLVPSWAKDPSIGSSLINARAETLAEKPSFRSALAKRRCLVPADGFYEWQATGAKTKQPVFIHLKDNPLFAFAGLWEEWKSPEGEPLRTCTLITTAPNELMIPFHDRMPVILSPEDEAHWLDPSASAQDALSLLGSYPADLMAAHHVSRAVNSPGNDGPELIAPSLS